MAPCATWSELFPDLGEPVLGDPGDYAAAVDHAGAAAESVSLCVEQFALVSAGDATRLRGASSDAIGWMFGEIDGSLGELPAVFESLVAVCAAHRDRLDALRTEAGSALARAVARRAAVGVAAADTDDAAGALAWVEQQLHRARQAADTGDTAAIVQVDALEAEHWYARNRVSATRAAHQAAVDALRSSRVEHAGLLVAEAELVQATRDAIGDIDLGELRDPNGWRNTLGNLLGAVWDWTGGALVDMVDGVIDAAVAVADGRFLDALHHLNHALDGALRLLTTITVAVVAVGTIVCPGALAALPVLLSVGQGLSAAEVAVGGTLLGTQHPHPETGAAVGLVEVLGAAVGAVVPARTGGGAAFARTGRAEAAVLARAGAGPGAARTFIRTPAETAAVLAAAAGGSRRVVNPATGQTVFGAAHDTMIRRATIEAGGYRVQGRLIAAVDDIVVGNAASTIVETGAGVGLGAIGPDAEATLNRAVIGSISTQVRNVIDAWRRGPTLRPGAAVYHLAAA